MNRPELISWIQKTFASAKVTTAAAADQKSKFLRMASLRQLIEKSGVLEIEALDQAISKEQTQALIIYYMAQMDSSLAWVYLNLLTQIKIRDFFKAQLQLDFDPSKLQFFSQEVISPLTSQVDVWGVSAEKLLQYSLAEAEELSYVSAFRDLPWVKFQRAHSVIAVLENTLNYQKQIHQSLQWTAALVAGIKKSSYLKAKTYSQQRQQGGRSIFNWSEVRMRLSGLHVTVMKDEALIPLMNPVLALEILRDSDQFVSSALQVFGGAGYIEDYQVEKDFREIHFLKNHFLLLPQAQLEIYRSEVQLE